VEEIVIGSVNLYQPYALTRVNVGVTQNDMILSMTHNQPAQIT
jgi:hypothetical protein